MGKFDYKVVLKPAAKREGATSSATAPKDNQKRKSYQVTPNLGRDEALSKKQQLIEIPDTEIVLRGSPKKVSGAAEKIICPDGATSAIRNKPFDINYKPGPISLWGVEYDPTPGIDSHVLHSADAQLMKKHGHKASMEAT